MGMWHVNECEIAEDEIMLTYDLGDCGNLPLYEALYTNIRRDIQDGTIAAGDRLPSKRSLARHLNVSVTTIEGAYRRLLEEGYIRSRPSSGYYVEERIAPRPALYHNYYADLYAADDFSIQDFRYGEEDADERSYGSFAQDPHDADELPAPGNEDADESFSMDFKGNRCSMTLFPMSVWTKTMRQLLSNPDRELLGTIPYNGLRSLRQAIAHYLRRYRGIKVNPSQVVIGAGTEYLYERLMHLFGQSALIAFEDPGYKKLVQVCTRTGVGHRFVPIDKEGMDVRVLAASRATVAHLSPSSHFPTGVTMSKRRRRELVEWAQSDPYRFIIEDDYDSEFAETGQKHPSLYSMDKAGRVIYMNTFSKVLVPSLRISYMILPESLLTLYRYGMSFYACTASGFEQQTLARFIEEGALERHLDRLRNYYGKKRRLLSNAIASSRLSDILTVADSSAGTHLLVQVDTHMSDADIHRAAQRINVKLQMLSDYCHRPRLADMHTLVINFAGMEEEDIATAVHMLERLFLEDSAPADI